MQLTAEQFNKLAHKDDLKDLATRADFDKFFEEIFAKLKIIMEKIEKIEKNFSLSKK